MTQPKPEWLEARWQKQKQATESKIKSAIDDLRKHSEDVSLSSICARVKQLHGESISQNTILRNQVAYDAYVGARKPLRTTRQSKTASLVKSVPQDIKSKVAARARYLQKYTKDDLIALMLQAESKIAASEQANQTLRDELLRRDEGRPVRR